MKHRRENGSGKVSRVRVDFDMLPRAIQRAGRDKQIDVLKKMFKRACNSYGILHEMKEREHYIKPGEKKRKAARLAKAVARGEIKDTRDFDKDFRSFDEYSA